jgi:hypothetical protein
MTTVIVAKVLIVDHDLSENTADEPRGVELETESPLFGREERFRGTGEKGSNPQRQRRHTIVDTPSSAD